ncbi:hypothetical protein LBBP_00877 [Leptospira borgpetersenii serovar Ballum]|uniref:Uncharacterized protein n=1 Tax=Leptospira borgpetersenii serovar Ballum TaxID=280505 RepID=A0A0S2INF4_LEPBO|nr:hypothetical protein LBBP_00877 [Leptospira borgpetersenii serovar Ballum]
MNIYGRFLYGYRRLRKIGLRAGIVGFLRKCTILTFEKI